MSPQVLGAVVVACPCVFCCFLLFWFVWIGLFCFVLFFREDLPRARKLVAQHPQLLI